MGKKLVLVRHSKAFQPEIGQTDHSRKLNPKGIERAGGVAVQLKALSIKPDCVLVSTSSRTRDTVAVFKPILNISDHNISFLDSLYLTDTDDYMNAIRECPDSCQTVMIIGHNPTTAWLANMLTNTHYSWATGSAMVLDCSINSWLNFYQNSAKFNSYIDAKLIA
ncbi:MAG: histidine phosphatase family protein [Bacteroidetes bacterium]|nr:histidine phosphatase family protein [Bacteroidota bacterium]